MIVSFPDTVHLQNFTYCNRWQIIFCVMTLVLAYRVGQKSKLLISSKCVNKTEKIGGM